MFRSSLRIIVFVVALHSHVLQRAAAAFVPQQHCNIISHRYAKARRGLVLSSGQGALSSPAGNAEETSGLKFSASMKYRTEPAPFPNADRTMTEFFKTDNYLLLPVGTRNKIKVAGRTRTDVMHRWLDEASRMGAAKPSRGDKVLTVSVRTPFLVFAIDVEATIGVKLLNPRPGKEKAKSSPEYQFVLLGKKFRADGPPPLVWIFNQLTGIDKTAKGVYEQPNHALFRVRAVLSDDGKGYVFASHMAAELNIKFPSVLLKLLPVAKEVIEEQGSKSLEESMKRDVPPGVDKFREEYIKWQVGE